MGHVEISCCVALAFIILGVEVGFYAPRYVNSCYLLSRSYILQNGQKVHARKECISQVIIIALTFFSLLWHHNFLIFDDWRTTMLLVQPIFDTIAHKVHRLWDKIGFRLMLLDLRWAQHWYVSKAEHINYITYKRGRLAKKPLFKYPGLRELDVRMMLSGASGVINLNYLNLTS